VKLLSEIAQLEYYLLCHGTFLLSDSTVCCAKYNGRNTILLKHASMVPQCGIAMEELFKEAQAQKDYTPIY
jgi:hypothetical protein